MPDFRHDPDAFRAALRRPAAVALAPLLLLSGATMVLVAGLTIAGVSQLSSSPAVELPLLGMGIAFLAGGALVRIRRPGERTSEWALAGALILCVFSILATTIFSSARPWPGVLEALLIAAGGLLTRRLVVLGTMGLIWLAWGGLALSVAGGEDLFHLTPGVLLGTALGLLLHLVRGWILDHLTALREAESRHMDEVTHKEAMLSLTQEVGKIGSYEWNLKTGEIRGSTTLFRLFGLNLRADDALSVAAFLEPIHPDDEADLRWALEEIRRGQRSELDVSYRIEAGGNGSRVVRNRGVTLIREGGVRVFVGTVHDETDRELEVARQRRALAQRQDALAALSRAARDPSNLSSVFREAVTRISDLLHARGVQLLERVGGEGSALRVRVRGAAPDADAERIVLDERSAEARAFRERRTTVRAPDGSSAGPAGRDAREDPMPVGSGFCVPIRGEFGPIGVLRVSSAPSQRFGEDDVAFVEDVAGVLGTAMAGFRPERERLAARSSLEDVERVANAGSWRRDIGSGELEWSAETFRIFGLEPKDFEGTYEAFLERVHPGDRSRVAEAVERAVAGMEPYQVEHRIVRPSGEIRHVEERGEVSYDDEGTPMTIVGVIRDITARKRVEEELAERERRFETLLESSPDGIVVADGEGCITLVNAAVEELFGWSREELIGRSVEVLIPEALHERHRRHRAEYMEAPRKRPMGSRTELVARRRDGETFSVQVSLSPLEMLSQGMVMATIRSVEEEKEREALVQLQTLALDSALTGIAVWDLQGRLSYANPAFRSLVGLEEGESLEGWTAMDFSPDAAEIIETLAVEGRWRGELTVERSDGERRTAQLVANTVPNLAGEPIGYVGSFVDVTERRRLREELERDRALLRAIFQHIPVMLAIDDPATGSLRVNREFERLTGWTDETLEGRSLKTACFPGATDDGDKAEFLRIGHPEWRDMSLTTRHGEELLSSWTSVALPGGRRVAIGLDVRERRQLEGRLEQSRKMEAVGQLAGGVAHDFNNLLTAISGNADLLKDALADTERPLVRRALSEIIQSADTAASLTRRLLTFSRREDVTTDVVDLVEVVDGMRGLLERLLPDDIVLLTDLPVSVLPVRADPTQIEQIVLNLAVNARDAMDDGGALKVGIGEQTLDEDDAAVFPDIPPGHYARLTIEDDGAGIPEETAARIFEPFFTTKDEGTGLGLATVYAVVRKLQGTVDVESESGSGTTFRIYLPVADGPVARPASDGSSTPESVDDRPRESRTILVVEDNPFVRQLSVSVLEEAGYRVLVADAGGQAVDLAAEYDRRIDLVVTDVVMPGMRGPDALEMIREQRPDVRVLFMSGYTGRGLDRRRIEDTDALFLQKPFKPEALLAKAREALRPLEGES